MASAPENITPATLASHSPLFSGYAPADFGDSEDTRPTVLNLDPTGTGALTPYSTLVSNVMLRHTYEIKEKNTLPLVPNMKWRHKLREFFFHKNEDLVNFLRKPLSAHPVLGQADSFIRKFARSDFSATNNTLQGIVLDISGEAIYTLLEQEVKIAGPANFTELTDEIRWIYDTYREAGDEITRKESILKIRLDTMDKTYRKVVGFMDLPNEEDTVELAEAIEKYMKKKFTESDIEDAYNETLKAYRRFYGLRQIVQFIRSTEIIDKEPLCSICMNEQVAYAMNPCGHTFCNTCSKRQMTQCYMCRVAVKERIRIFFG